VPLDAIPNGVRAVQQAALEYFALLLNDPIAALTTHPRTVALAYLLSLVHHPPTQRSAMSAMIVKRQPC
jgi:hypothetical protein